MAGQHTPGPWEACQPYDYGDFDGESRLVCGDDMRIAVVHWHPHLNAEMWDANAHLIAAAPELLEALETLEAALIRDLGAGYAGVALCQAAIAKARGEA